MSRGDWEIRIAGAADADAVRRLVAAFRDHLAARAPTDAELEAFLPTALAAPDVEFACAFSRDARPLGYTQTTFFPSVWVAGREARLEDLFVVPAVRGAGLGARLLEFALSRAGERGARLVGLNTNERNEAARRLYARAGFRLQTEAVWSGGREVRWTKRLDRG